MLALVIALPQAFVTDLQVFQSENGTVIQSICTENWSNSAVRNGYTIILMATTYIIPFFILVAIYTYVTCILWRKKIRRGEKYSSGCKHPRQKAVTKKIIKVILKS